MPLIYWYLLFAVSSIIWVEVVRDVYHSLSHRWKPLYRWHAWHHRVFRPDLTAANLTIYRQAHWYNDVPEAIVMLILSLVPWAVAVGCGFDYGGGAWLGSLYTMSFLATAVARGLGIPYADEFTDLTHRPGQFQSLPARWLVNRPYHWRHHFDNQNAYFSGTFTLVDQVMGTALSLKGKTIAVTGASGTLGRALLKHLIREGAKAIALTSSQDQVTIETSGDSVAVKTIQWQVGQEDQLAEVLTSVDILIINHGVNVHGARSAEAIARSYQVNTFSSWRLLELFFTTIQTNQDRACKEVWVNTSEAEVNPAFSPLYEMSKRTLGDLVTLRRLDAPCRVRKLILGPFRSNLNPIGVMSPDWVAKQIIALAKRDVRNIIVTINPITFFLLPLHEIWKSIYFKLFSRNQADDINDKLDSKLIVKS